MKIGIIVAMDKEFAQLRSILDNAVAEHRNHKDFVLGQIGGKEIVLQKCGIGKVNSAVGAVEMINNYQPDLIISSGCAGGADTSLEMLDVVVAEECVYHDAYCGDEQQFGQIMGMPARYKASRELIEKALLLNNSEADIKMNVRAGLTVSGEWFVNRKEKMQSIMDKFPDATAVDMESCSIAQVCHIYNVPFVSFRVISDVPLKDTNASQYYDFWSRAAEGSFEVTRHFIQSL
ncbi:5'-methylthioadenosine/adenosylhomocysteine nucleosidase [Prevotella sp. HUN102]|uniref:5'-methylthioadenosine/adenosylhomocysteine nucleosidase n=1 Tax=Prevotella sp. HUN102 TaxID=1392486 RepID=UPI00048AB0F0|nr:5'-methylthioadenosine/adenosylhomocysteine nucleosidase [Prevotella sp. HUN102]